MPNKGNEPPGFDPATAGMTLLAAVFLSAAVGFGLGTLLGAKPLITIVAVFVGFAIGFRLVYTRFRHI